MSNYFAISILAAIVFTGSIFGVPLFFSGEREIGQLENIHGIPFGVNEGEVQITEALAHLDIFLKEPVIAKNLHITISFKPGKTNTIEVGVRENSFWLSYTPVLIYDGSKDVGTAVVTKVVTIPLTDKLQEPNRSIDLMFFANKAKEQNRLDLKNADNTDWKLVSLRAEVSPIVPNWASTKDYVKSVVYKEKAL